MMLIQSEQLNKYQDKLIHGVTAGIFSFDSGFSIDEIIKNRKNFLNPLNIDLNSLVLMEQMHGDNIEIIDYRQRGAGALDQKTKIKATDGLITNTTNAALGIFTADCLPVLFFDPVKNVIGAVHAGWKGVLNEICVKMINKFSQFYHSKPEDLIVYLGPGIGGCCYEVSQCDDKRFEQYKKIFNSNSEVIKEKNNLIYLNLKKAVEKQLLSVGIRLANLEISSICTYCDQRNFPSHRREGKDRFRDFFSVIGLENGIKGKQ